MACRAAVTAVIEGGIGSGRGWYLGALRSVVE